MNRLLAHARPSNPSRLFRASRLLLVGPPLAGVPLRRTRANGDGRPSSLLSAKRDGTAASAGPTKFLLSWARLLFFGLCLPAFVRAAEPTSPTPAPASTALAAPRAPTIIESAGPAEMVSTATESTFTFRDKVVVTGTGLLLTCDQLVVVARRTGDPKATLGKQDNFKSLLATGHVRLLQGDREATCGRAEVLPGEDKVILTEDPKVRLLDGSYEASGPRMLLLRGERRAVIEGGSRFILPPIRDLGPGKPKPADNKSSPPADAAPKVAAPK